MTLKTLPATEVKNRFGRVLREVSQTGGPIVVERDGKPVVVIVSIGEYERLQRQSLRPQQEKALLQAAFGMWANRDDIDDTWLADGRSRWENKWRGE